MGVKTGGSRELPHAIFCPSFGLEIIHPLNGPTDLTHVETFSGAACLTRFAVRQGAETNIVGSFRCDPKRLPSRRASVRPLAVSPIRPLANTPTRHRHRHHPALVFRDSDIP